MVDDLPEDRKPDDNDESTPGKGRPAKGQRIVRVYFARPAEPGTVRGPAPRDDTGDTPPRQPVYRPGFDPEPIEGEIIAEHHIPRSPEPPEIELHPADEEEEVAPPKRKKRRRRSPFAVLLIALGVILLFGLAGVAAALAFDLIPPEVLDRVPFLPLLRERPAGEEVSPGTGLVELDADADPVATERAAAAIATMAAANAPPTTAPAELETVIDQRGTEMVLVPGGTFLMGGGPAEPAHEVTLDAFYIDRYEVSQEQWQQCVVEGACLPPSPTGDEPGEDTYGLAEFARHPVTNINWQNANAYCRWRGGALPTEAQWEMAARWNPVTGAVSIYPWGDEWDAARLNTCDASCPLEEANLDTDDGWRQTAPVDSFPEGASPVGAFNMVGNVAEWIADWYAEDYYENAPAKNPTGPESGTERVVRGGAWNIADPALFDARARSSFDPTNGSPGIGVRCIIPADMVSSQERNEPQG
ncbi:MAG TPA: SUMF1/EgtB/PvdO family nonheme iron enzyme [Aggregatilineales bacterium]|nr:SUMF1/EgtB/PvdO family nonheme iron enzyme [Aggregatilineales bacterium]HPV07448.1 SUMF1/EgtB/PvdO family nonheme iron enzyme [Aggregatilineales bacterium]HQA67662.1 SUMF1/EgtB/PvdO family nonheme iron enzyme [Aggregatilineales bacterium]